jgi:hypothetical protein
MVKRRTLSLLLVTRILENPRANATKFLHTVTDSLPVPGQPSPWSPPDSTRVPRWRRGRTRCGEELTTYSAHSCTWRARGPSPPWPQQPRPARPAGPWTSRPRPPRLRRLLLRRRRRASPDRAAARRPRRWAWARRHSPRAGRLSPATASYRAAHARGWSRRHSPTPRRPCRRPSRQSRLLRLRPGARAWRPARVAAPRVAQLAARAAARQRQHHACHGPRPALSRRAETPAPCPCLCPCPCPSLGPYPCPCPCRDRGRAGRGRGRGRGPSTYAGHARPRAYRGPL